MTTPKFSTSQLLESLTADVQEILIQTEQLRSYSDKELRKKPDEYSWSIVEILAHLNFYARYYIEAMEKGLSGHNTQKKAYFRSGWLGNYFTNMVGPSPQGEPANKMKTYKDAVPEQPFLLDPETEINEFIDHQKILLTLLENATWANLGRIRIPISISRFIRLKLGDTFRFVIAHEQRHFQQIERVKGSFEKVLESL